MKWTNRDVANGRRDEEDPFGDEICGRWTMWRKAVDALHRDL